MLSKNELVKILSPYLSTDQLSKIEVEYADIQDKELYEIGVDSLALMGVLMNIEELTGKQFDFSTMDFDKINSLSKIEDTIHENN